MISLLHDELQWIQISIFLESPVTVIYRKDLSAPLSCSDPWLYRHHSACHRSRWRIRDSEFFQGMISSISAYGKASIQFHNGYQEPSGCSRWVSVSCQLIDWLSASISPQAPSPLPSIVYLLLSPQRSCWLTRSRPRSRSVLYPQTSKWHKIKNTNKTRCP